MRLTVTDAFLLVVVHLIRETHETSRDLLAFDGLREISACLRDLRSQLTFEPLEILLKASSPLCNDAAFCIFFK